MYDNTSSRISSHQVLWIIIGVALISHSLLLLSEGIFFDDWLLYTDMMQSQWSHLYQWVADMGGFPTLYFIFRVIGWFPESVLTFRLFELGALLIVAWSTYQILHLRNLLSVEDALLVAVLLLLYPGFKSIVSFVHVGYLIMYAMFALGFYFMLWQETLTKKIKIVVRLCALVLLFVSFKLSSLLVVFYVLLVGLSLNEWQKQSNQTVLALAQHQLNRIDFWLLPLFYWLITKLFFASGGLYKSTHYNEIKLQWDRIWSLMQTSISNGTWRQIEQNLLDNHLPTMVYLLLTALILLLLPVFQLKSTGTYTIKYRFTSLLFGLLLLLATVFPYAAVGKMVAVNGWDSRHSLLMGLPVALLLTLFLRSLPGYYIRQLLLAICLLSFSSNLMSNYLTWQARSIKDQSVLQQLQSHQQLKENVVFLIQDDARLTPEPYRFYEWSAMFEQIWPDRARMGLDLSLYPLDFPFNSVQFHNKSYFLHNFNPLHGCWAHIQIKPGALIRNKVLWDYVAQYYYHRFFSTQAQLEQFLADVVELSVNPAKLENVAGMQCERDKALANE